MTRKERHIQLADALILVARANHYMIGITEPIRENDLVGATVELISRQNEMGENDPDFAVIDLALNLADARIGMTVLPDSN